MALFEPAFSFTMDNEDRHRSGKVTVDQGGRTRFGIAENWHHDMPAAFWTGPAEDALHMAADVYRAEYWRPIRGSEIQDQRVASKIFDTRVNLPPRIAIEIVQRALEASGQKITADGQMGPATLCAINGVSPEQLLEAIVTLQAQHYREKGDPRYLPGLLNRAHALPPTSA